MPDHLDKLIASGVVTITREPSTNAVRVRVLTPEEQAFIERHEMLHSVYGAHSPPPARQRYYEPIRPLRAPDDGSAFYHVAVFGEAVVHYGECYWPSKSYWLVPLP